MTDNTNPKESQAREWLERYSKERGIYPANWDWHITEFITAYAAHVCAERDKEIERISSLNQDLATKWQTAERRCDWNYKISEIIREDKEMAEAALAEEKSIVDRVWKALGISTYADAEGKAIDELVADLVSLRNTLPEKAQQAAEVCRRLAEYHCKCVMKGQASDVTENRFRESILRVFGGEQ